MRYAVVIEKAENNYSAYVPDLPGCVATGATVEETEHLLREAIELHLIGLREDGLPIPQPISQIEYIEVGAQRRSRAPSSTVGVKNAAISSSDANPHGRIVPYLLEPPLAYRHRDGRVPHVLQQATAKFRPLHPGRPRRAAQLSRSLARIEAPTFLPV